jgi:hypothetical protein
MIIITFTEHPSPSESCNWSKTIYVSVVTTSPTYSNNWTSIINSTESKRDLKLTILLSAKAGGRDIL